MIDINQIKFDPQALDQLELPPEALDASIRSINHPGQSTAISTVKTETPGMPILYVFRHGESEDNARKIFSGWRDSPLTAVGRQQAEILAEKLKTKSLDLAYTSRLSRAQETLTIVLKYHSQTPVKIDDRIIERNYGDLSGLSKSELSAINPKLCAAFRRSYDFPIPGGETMKDVEVRVKSFLDELLARIKRDHLHVALSCHGNSMRAIRRFMEHLTVNQMLSLENPLGTDYCSYSIE